MSPRLQCHCHFYEQEIIYSYKPLWQSSGYDVCLARGLLIACADSLHVA